MRPTKLNDKKLALLIAFTLAIPAVPCSLSTTLPVFAQSSEGSSVAMVSLHTFDQNGQQMVITPKGMTLPLPGGGVNGNVVQVYIGSNGGYWYVDRNGQTVDLTKYAQMAKGGGQYNNQMPQYAPVPQQNVTQTTNTGGGGSAVGTAAAAGLGAMGGAMAGAAISGSYYNNVPYGTPMYYGAGNRAYYNGAGGKPVYVNNSTNTMNNTANVNASATNNEQHYNNLQQQQKWYQEQSKNADQMKQWQNAQGQNPFVANNAGEGQGRFGRGGDDGGAGGGGRFGRRGGQDAEGGAGFGQAAQQQEGGGRFGGRFNRGGDGGAAASGGFGQREGGALGGGNAGERRGGRGGRFGR